MKKILFQNSTWLLVAAFIAVGTLASCNNSKKQESKEQVKIEVTTPDGTTDFTVYDYAQKDQAVQEANNELDKLNRRIDELKAEANAKTNELSADAKKSYDNAIADLEKSRDNYQAKVDDLQNSTQENWEQAKKDVNQTYRDAKTGAEKGWKKLKDGVNDAVKEVEKAVK
ncbi:hypothetical protein [Limibacterium fermenti]|uniref:hypothetical protein n=1 Tax=Limibacterium fermenti TaxID=3229863 RepID=UPI0026945270